MKTYNLKIYGKDYRMTSQYEEVYINEMADYLDTTMKKVSETTGVLDFYKLLILSSLHIVDDYLKLVKECKETGGNPKLLKKIEHMIHNIENSLTDPVIHVMSGKS